MMKRIKDAAKKARAETAVRRAMEAEGLKGDVTVRLMQTGPTASIVVEGPDQGKDRELEIRLRDASGLGRVTIVRTEHGPAAASPQASRPAPPARKRAGGHSDPLNLGARPRERSAPVRPEGVRKVIAVASGKGGVGKSTVAAGLALELARRGKSVGLLDLDIHGPSLPVLFPAGERIRSEDGKILPLEREGLKLVSIGYMVDERKAVAWRGPMVMNAARQLIEDTAWGELDVLVVDTPPGTGDAHLSMVQRLKLDGALLVATPSPLATADVRRGAALFQTTGTKVLGIVLNMTGGPMGDDLDPALLEEMNLPVLERLPMSPEAAAVPLSAEGGANLPAAADQVLATGGEEPRDSPAGTL